MFPEVRDNRREFGDFNFVSIENIGATSGARSQP
jgi:hypothetical protein